ncbi:hypothetical protein CU669_03170 [Paramagnetospirillum kuznetsovii]|uniref:Uncharacterized protein n=1 Tax=Paramagnetospirillum kuznetsovii TaxID=2053833 RepID=A0A364P1K0_9PROT|nr:hypothetical protein CU669_03170 [Paramagnetospirillum kuznetsovii]
MKKEAPSATDAIAFTTPVIKVDTNTGLALLVVRDGSTGEEKDQYPSKKAVAEYQRVQTGSSDSKPAAAAPTDDGSSLAADATVPPAPVPVVAVAAPPVSPATGDPATTVAAATGVKN